MDEQIKKAIREHEWARNTQSDSAGALVASHACVAALRAAGVTTVSHLRAHYEEHGGLQHLRRIGPARESELLEALELYDLHELPLDDPQVRADARAVSSLRAAAALVQVGNLTIDDHDLTQRLIDLADELLAGVRHADVPDKGVRYEEAWRFVRAAKAGA